MSNDWGYCGIAVYHPKTRDNVGTLWRSAYAFGAQFLCTVGRRYEKQASDTVRAPRKIPLFETANLKELKGRLPVGCQLVGVELVESAEDLKRLYTWALTGVDPADRERKGDDA